MPTPKKTPQPQAQAPILSLSGEIESSEDVSLEQPVSYYPPTYAAPAPIVARPLQVEYPFPMENRIITLKAVDGKQKGPNFISPEPDLETGGYKGIYHWSEEDKRRYPKEITDINADYMMVVKDGHKFDLSKPMHACQWNYVKEHRWIARDEEELKIKPEALLYVDEPEVVQLKELKTRKSRFELEAWIRSLSSAESLKVCRMLKQVGAENWKPADIEDYLTDLCRNAKGQALADLQAIKVQLEEGTAHTKLFLYSLIDAKIIFISQHGTFRYENQSTGVGFTLGLNEEQALYYLDNPANNEMIKAFQLELNTRARKR